MKLFVVVLAGLLGAASAAPDKLPVGRRSGRQSDTGYGAPPETGYGSPDGEAEDAALAGYGDEGLDAQASDDSLAFAEGGDDPSGADPLDMLMKAVPGIPGEDYPIFAEAPETSFSCDGQVNGGYYADEEAECQVFHICTSDAEGGLSKYSFLCPNGTIFNQEYFICDWWFNVDCSESAALAEAKNGELQGAREEASAALAEAGEEGGDLDYEASDESLSGYLAAEESAPVASYGVGPASEDDAASAPLPSYEDDQAQYTSFRF